VEEATSGAYKSVDNEGGLNALPSHPSASLFGSRSSTLGSRSFLRGPEQSPEINTGKPSGHFPPTRPLSPVLSLSLLSYLSCLSPP